MWVTGQQCGVRGGPRGLSGLLHSKRHVSGDVAVGRRVGSGVTATSSGGSGVGVEWPTFVSADAVVAAGAAGAVCGVDGGGALTLSSMSPSLA